jgi:hypothetical protein
LRRVAFDQGFSLRAVVTLTRRQNEAQRIAKRVNGDVNLSRKAAAASA